MMPFDDEVFPETILTGAGGPSFPTTVLKTRSGMEYRVANTQMQTHTFDVSPLVRTEIAFQEVINFISARNGSARGFRYKDWNDYSTAPDDVDVPSSSDVSGKIIFEEDEYRIYKRYDDGSGHPYDRRIYKPRLASFVLLNSGTPVSGSTFDITEKGCIEFDGSPPGGTLTWYGEFDVPVHFMKDGDDGISISFDDFRDDRMSVALNETSLADNQLEWETDTPVYPTELPDLTGDTELTELNGSHPGGSGGEGQGNPGSPEDPELTWTGSYCCTTMEACTPEDACVSGGGPCACLGWAGDPFGDYASAFSWCSGAGGTLFICAPE